MSLSDRLILWLDVSSSTPLFIGGYDTLRVHALGKGVVVEEPLRTQSLKGVIRWWSRAFIAGSLRRKIGSFSPRDVARISSIIWGGVLGSKAFASPFLVRVITKEVRPCSGSDNRLLSDHQSVKLFLLGKSSNYRQSQNLCGWYRASIYLYNRLGAQVGSNISSFAESILFSSFILGCLGKASRRGLGCFEVERAQFLQTFLSRINWGLPGSIGELVRMVSRQADSITESLPGYIRQSANGAELPRVPAIDSGSYRLFVCTAEDGRYFDPVEASIKFSKCVTRQFRTRTGRDPLYENLMAWILGLPRSQRGTGYLVQGGYDRRASPIIFTVHRNYALLSVFYSSDWPPYIEWVGSGSKSISVEEETVKEALDTATSFLVETCLPHGRLGLPITCSEVKIW